MAEDRECQRKSKNRQFARRSRDRILERLEDQQRVIPPLLGERHPDLPGDPPQRADIARFLRVADRNDIFEPGMCRVRLLADQLFRQASLSKDEEDPRTRNLALQDGTVHYQPEPDHQEKPGVYISGRVLR